MKYHVTRAPRLFFTYPFTLKVMVLFVQQIYSLFTSLLRKVSTICQSTSTNWRKIPTRPYKNQQHFDLPRHKSGKKPIINVVVVAFYNFKCCSTVMIVLLGKLPFDSWWCLADLRAESNLNVLHVGSTTYLCKE